MEENKAVVPCLFLVVALFTMLFLLFYFVLKAAV